MGEMGKNPDRNFTAEVIRVIKSIPRGKVATYGQIACLAGFCPSVRRVVWILHSCSDKEGLPWHRVVNRRGAISLKPGAGYKKQKAMLKKEGIIFDERDRIDLDRYLWEPGGKYFI
ncbi:MAG: MGMT family protein [Candidatus Aminicenantes bacterium]|jgi:methylated-DNA-protein-cysteine methyltransferase-like protein